MIVSKSGNMVFREIDFDDVTNEYVRWMNDPEVTQFLGVRFREMTGTALRCDINDVLQNDNIHMFTIHYIHATRALHIGNIKLVVDPRHNKGVVSLVIGNKDYWGKGIGTKAIWYLTEWAFQHLKLHHVSAGFYENHKASYAIFKKAGYEFYYRIHYDKIFEGHYVDSVFYVKNRENLK